MFLYDSMNTWRIAGRLHRCGFGSVNGLEVVRVSLHRDRLVDLETGKIRASARGGTSDGTLLIVVFAIFT